MPGRPGRARRPVVLAAFIQRRARKRVDLLKTFGDEREVDRHRVPLVLVQA